MPDRTLHMPGFGSFHYDDLSDTEFLSAYRAQVGRVPSTAQDVLRLEDLINIFQAASVIDIDNPSVELASLSSNIQGGFLIVYEILDPNQYTIYCWDSSASGADIPYVVAGAGGYWIAVAGKYSDISFSVDANILTKGNVQFSDSNTEIWEDGSNNLTFKDSVTGTKTLAELATSTSPGGNDGEIQYNNSGSFGGDSSLFWNDSSKYLGIKTNTPSFAVHIIDTDIVRLSGDVYSNDDADCFYLQARRARNTRINPNAVEINNRLFFIPIYGHDGSDFYIGAAIDFKAEETWSGTNRGTFIAFDTISIGETIRSEKFRITANGNLWFKDTNVQIWRDINDLSFKDPNAGTIKLTDFITHKHDTHTLENDAINSNGAAGFTLLATGGNININTGTGGITLHTITGDFAVDTQQIYCKNAGNLIGFGTANPLHDIHMQKETDYFNLAVYVYSTNATHCPFYNNKRAGGTVASPTQVLIGARLALFRASGYGASTFVSSSQISFYAEENFTDAAGGGNIRFETSNLGTTVPTEKMIIKANGYIGIGETSPEVRLHITDNGLIPGGDSVVAIRQDDDAVRGLVIGNDTEDSLIGRGMRFSVDGNKRGNIDVYVTSAQRDLLINSFGGKVGIGTLSPDSKLEITDSTSPQLILSYTEASTFATFQVDSSGYMTITSSGGNIIVDHWLTLGTTAGSHDGVLLVRASSTSSSSGIIFDDGTLDAGLTYNHNIRTLIFTSAGGDKMTVDGNGIRILSALEVVGNVGFFDETPVAQKAHIINADGTLADITAKFNTLLTYFETGGGFGLIANT